MVLNTAVGPAALRTAVSTASTSCALRVAASCEVGARVVTPTSISTRSGLAVTLAFALTRIDDTGGCCANALQHARQARTVMKCFMCPVPAERDRTFYARRVRQFIV